MPSRLVTTARCACGWTAPPGDWTAMDRAAEKHVRAGHQVATVTVSDG